MQYDKRKLGNQELFGELINCRKARKGFTADKFVSDIDDNKVLLLDAINDLRQADKEIILDGVELNKEALVAENVYWAETEYRSNINVKPIGQHKSISTTRPIRSNEN